MYNSFGGNLSEFSKVYGLINNVMDRNISGALLDNYAWRYHLTQRAHDERNIAYGNLALFFNHQSSKNYYGVMGKGIDDGLWQCMATVGLDNEAKTSRQLNVGWSMLEVCLCYS